MWVMVLLMAIAGVMGAGVFALGYGMGATLERDEIRDAIDDCVLRGDLGEGERAGLERALQIVEARGESGR